MKVLTYNGGPFRLGQLSNELLAAGIRPLTLRGKGETRVDVVLTDDAPAASVDAVVAAHRPADESLDKPLTLREARQLFQPKQPSNGVKPIG